MLAVLASIPSPDSGTIDVGPLTLHMYGLMLLLAIAVCVVLTGLRRTRRFLWRPDTSETRDPDWDLTLRTAVWGVGAGIVGARAYHVLTSWDEVPDPKSRGVFEVWEGGLGVWGGIFLGVVVGAIVVHRSGESVLRFLDAVAPGLLLAQALGRWGNWFNQELFGEPSDLPWALEIDFENRPEQFAADPTFHPTFLYESLWALLGVFVLLLVDRWLRIRPPGLFCLYVAWYTFGRFFMELLRVDEAHEWFGLRLNAWVSIGVFVLALVAFVWSQRRRERGPRRGSAPPPPPERPKMAVPKGRIR